VYRWNVTLTTCTPGSSECTREAIPASNGPNLAFTTPTTSGALEMAVQRRPSWCRWR